MKASEIEPNSWYCGLNKPKTRAFMRKWADIQKNARRMEELLPLLMNNPETTPEQLVIAWMRFKMILLELLRLPLNLRLITLL